MHRECLLVDQEEYSQEPQTQDCHFSLIAPVMLTHFMQSGHLGKHTTLWNYEQEHDHHGKDDEFEEQQRYWKQRAYGQPGRFLCSDAEAVQSMQRHIHERLNDSGSSYGQLMACIPDSWVMFSYCKVPKYIKPKAVHQHVKCMLSALFPYPQDALYFDYFRVPEIMYQQLGMLDQSRLDLYQVLACDQGKINALKQCMQPFNLKLVSVLPRRYCIIYGRIALRQWLAMQTDAVDAGAVKNGKIIQHNRKTLHRSWKSWQQLKLVLGLQNAYDLWGFSSKHIELKGSAVPH